MKRNPNIPKIKEKLYIICEGIGDKIYLDRIFSFYESKYDIKVIQSGGKNKVVSKLREVLILHPHNEYYIFINTDMDGNNTIIQYEKEMKQEEIPYMNKIYFVNPIVEYLYLVTKVDMHPTNFYSKSKYVNVFKKYFNIVEYNGTLKQYEMMAKKIDRESFEKSLCKIKTSINENPSSTIIELKNRVIK